MSRNGRSAVKQSFKRKIGDERQPCTYCGRLVRPSKIRADHAIPICRGGDDNVSNLVPSCAECDRLKGPLTDAEFMSVRHDPVMRKGMIREVFEAVRRYDARTSQGDGEP